MKYIVRLKEKIKPFFEGYQPQYYFKIKKEGNHDN
jgi:hypothetical protein